MKSFLFLLLSLTAATSAADPFADEVVSFSPGTFAGFGADGMPGVVLGPPRGTSGADGSLHTVSLGIGGEIVLAFDPPGICDGPGPDLIVFENAFYSGGTDTVFEEVGIVAAGVDLDALVTFPYDPNSLVGLAGRTPVFSHPNNGIDPTDPSVAGGDAFDLADVGLTRARFVRIIDPGNEIEDLGNRLPPGDSGGFDLDAIAAIHECGDGPSTPTPTATATIEPTDVLATPTPSPEATPTSMLPPTGTPTRTLSPTRTPLPGDANGDGSVSPSDLSFAAAELFDGDGERAGDVAMGRVASHEGVDANADGVVSAADLVGMYRLVSDPNRASSEGSMSAYVGPAAPATYRKGGGHSPPYAYSNRPPGSLAARCWPG